MLTVGSFGFILFAALLAGLWRVTPQPRRWQLMLAASLVFYLSLDWQGCLLLCLMTLLVWQAALHLRKNVRRQIYAGAHAACPDVSYSGKASRKHRGSNLQAQKGAALLHLMEFMSLLRVEQHHLTGLCHMPEGSRLHGESSLHQPDQFEFLMNMRRAVIHCVKKNPQPVDLRVLNNLGFVHALPLLSTFRAAARRHLKQARRTAVSVLRACFDFPMCLLHCFR